MLLMVGGKRWPAWMATLAIVYGDGPLLRAETLERLVDGRRGDPSGPGGRRSAERHDGRPTGYGRVIRGAGARGPAVARIVEQKAATPDELASAKPTWDLLLPRGPVLEARGGDPAGQPGGVSITSPNGGNPQPGGALRGSAADRTIPVKRWESTIA